MRRRLRHQQPSWLGPRRRSSIASRWVRTAGPPERECMGGGCGVRAQGAVQAHEEGVREVGRRWQRIYIVTRERSDEAVVVTPLGVRKTRSFQGRGYPQKPEPGDDDQDPEAPEKVAVQPQEPPVPKPPAEEERVHRVNVSRSDVAKRKCVRTRRRGRRSTRRQREKRKWR